MISTFSYAYWLSYVFYLGVCINIFSFSGVYFQWVPLAMQKFFLILFTSICLFLFFFIDCLWSSPWEYLWGLLPEGFYLCFLQRAAREPVPHIYYWGYLISIIGFTQLLCLEIDHITVQIALTITTDDDQVYSKLFHILISIVMGGGCDEFLAVFFCFEPLPDGEVSSRGCLLSFVPMVAPSCFLGNVSPSCDPGTIC